MSSAHEKSARRPPTEITPEEVRGALNLYKAKLSLMSRSSKSSKREIKTALNACAQNTTGLFLKSNLEYLRQNFRKAIKLLNNSCQKNERDPNVPALYFNNMGCIHHCMRRHTAAAFYFTRALMENDALYEKASTGDGISLTAFSCDRRCELEYNRALQLLFSGRPEQAFSSFHAALHLYHRQPRIWLRLGEACVAQHVLEREQQQKEQQRPQLSPLIGSAAGSGESRRLVLPVNSEQLDERPEAPPSEDPPMAEAAPSVTPSPTLAYGIKCLRNALQLCEAQVRSVATADYSALQTSSSQGTLTSSEELALQMHIVLRLSLLQLSWCALLQDDYVQGLHCSTQLLTDDCPANIK